MAQRDGKIKILIDTDIADDIDDAFALAFSLGSPEFDILGVTVVYGDVETRAKVALLTLGAMTNVATTISADPGLAIQIKAVYSQAGGIPPLPPTHFDWNICYDVVAAQTIARCGVPWTTVGGVRGDNHPGRTEFDALESSGLPSAKVLLDLAVHMKRYKLGQDPSARTIKDVQSASICDLIVPAALLVPEPMKLERGEVDINDQGRPQYRPDPAGPHRWPTARLADGSFRGELLRRLLSAPGTP